ncbi:pentapeptide repeat protein [Tamaricihabitans halophyticus]|uniref:Pentapeptide repeat protein n=1 Tax=Tamaricihabitans halophyticus TaxID=1262583 RepID=A0A4R2R397_9PSEU|nr:pentapeptide repeat-containing protein [Tamaricihabitans halophyticus]TCP56159.1 pentapeptide repeat protein [Tamaricihabitans halophyticus]
MVERARAELVADCARCFALCCVALPFTASADFAIDKAAGQPCPNLLADFRCGIHDRLRPEGFPGCVAFDCFGAGQRVSRETFAGVDWRSQSDGGRAMFEVFPVVRQLHELLWYLADVRAIPAANELRGALDELAARIDRLASGNPAELRELDVPALRAEVSPLLLRASELARAGVRGRKKDRRGADLLGANLRAADLRGVSLRGACLIAADLRGADLRSADVLGADLRDARLAGADLRDSLFLTRAQLDAARGDANTRLPAQLARPTHWLGATDADSP